MMFGSGSMLSFGYTLLIGMVLNLFIGVNISKQLLLSMTHFKRWNNEKCFSEKRIGWEYHSIRKNTFLLFSQV